MQFTMRTDDVLRVHIPTVASSPLVLDSPHSGHVFPNDFGTALAVDVLRTAEDVYINELYAAAPRHGAHLLEAQFPRSYIDPNRAEGDIDLDLLDEPWPHHFQPSGKARLGKALVWRTMDDGTPIYTRRLSAATVQHRIQNYLHPYQNALKALLDSAHAAHGVVYHINCHSMEPVGGLMAEGGAGIPRADVVLGDRDGTTCSSAFTQHVALFFEACGYSVAINKPYKGVELVRKYSDPSAGRHSLQIELNKNLYVHPGTRERNANFTALERHLDDLMASLVQYARAP
jgi:N-formylglutamate amidohydrolase